MTNLYNDDAAHIRNFGSVDYASGDSDKAAGGSVLEAMGYDAKDLKDASLLKRAIIEAQAFNARNHSSLAALLTMLSAKSSGFRGHVLEWPAGDRAVNATTLGTGTTSSIMKTNDPSSMQIGQEFICQAVHNNGGGTANRCYVYGRVTSVDDHDSADDGTGLGSYGYTVLGYGGNNAGTTVDALDDMSDDDPVVFLTETQQLDGRAPAPDRINPVWLENYSERVRSSSVEGTHTQAHPSAFNSGLEFQMTQKYLSFMTRLNHKLYYSDLGTNPQTTAGNVGRFLGLPHFLKPYSVTDTLEDKNGNDTGMRGYNKVFTNSFTWFDFNRYMSGPMKYSINRYKMICASADTAITLLEKMRGGDDVRLNQSMISIPGSNKIWSGIKVTMAAGTIYLIIDSDLDSMNYLIHAKSENDVTCDLASYSRFGFVIDPDFIKMVWADVPKDGGIQTPQLRDVKLEEMNDSRRMKEYNAQGSLWLKRPEAFGIFGLGATEPS